MLATGAKRHATRVVVRKATSGRRPQQQRRQLYLYFGGTGETKFGHPFRTDVPGAVDESVGARLAKAYKRETHRYPGPAGFMGGPLGTPGAKAASLARWSKVLWNGPVPEDHFTWLDSLWNGQPETSDRATNAPAPEFEWPRPYKWFRDFLYGLPQKEMEELLLDAHERILRAMESGDKELVIAGFSRGTQAAHLLMKSLQLGLRRRAPGKGFFDAPIVVPGPIPVDAVVDLDSVTATPEIGQAWDIDPEAAGFVVKPQKDLQVPSNVKLFDEVKALNERRAAFASPSRPPVDANATRVIKHSVPGKHSDTGGLGQDIIGAGTAAQVQKDLYDAGVSIEDPGEAGEKSIAALRDAQPSPEGLADQVAILALGRHDRSGPEK